MEEGREARKCLAAGRSNFQSWLASMSFCQRQHVPAWTQRSVRSDRNSGETRETGKHREAGELARLMVTMTGTLYNCQVVVCGLSCKQI